MPKLQISQWPAAIEAGQKTLLDAALDAGVPFPHSCMSGECGQCKCQLLSGEVQRLSASPDALSAADIAAGRLLACRSKARSDIELSWLASSQSSAAIVRCRARVTALEPAAHDVMIVRLRPGQALNFLPGQFAKLGFGKLPQRSYSMANLPETEDLEFHIRVVPDGRVSQFVARSLRLGDGVDIEGPFGDAHWQGASAAPLLLLAGGTGLAPIVSLLDAALRDGHPPQQIHVYHGVREARDLYAGARLQRLAEEHGFRFQPVFSAGENASHLHEAVARDFACLKSAQIYVAGPPPMVDAVKQTATARGAAAGQIRADAFHAARPEKKSWWRRLLD